MSTVVGGQTLKENGSVEIGNLEQPLIEPLLYTITSKLTQEILDSLSGTTEINGKFVYNYFGLVKFVYRSKTYYGRLIKIETDEQTKIELISIH